MGRLLTTAQSRSTAHATSDALYKLAMISSRGTPLCWANNSQDRTERAALVSRFRSFQYDVTADLMHLRVLPSPAQCISANPRRPGESSCDGQDLVADEVQANSLREW